MHKPLFTKMEEESPSIMRQSFPYPFMNAPSTTLSRKSETRYYIFAELLFTLIVFYFFWAQIRDFFTAVIATVIVLLLYRFSCRAKICSLAYQSSGVHQLAESGDLEGLRRALAKGVSIDARDDQRCTFLHWAVASDEVPLSEFLITNGIDVNAVNANGSTALHLAAARDNLEIARMLLEYGANKNIYDVNRRMPVDFARSNAMKIMLQIPLFQSSTSSNRIFQV